MQKVDSDLKKYPDYSFDPIFRNFINSIKSPVTKQSYTHSLNKYYLSRPENQNLTLLQIISKAPKTIEYELLDIIYYMKDKQGLSYSSVHSTLAAIIHFFEINDVAINKKKLSKFKGENISKFEYRGYTHEEINSILPSLDERGRASVLLMASTGMRVGALPDLKLKHLKRWNIDNSNNNSQIYQITVYANSPKHKYMTFCTPEAAKAIDHYLEFRMRHGDKLNRDQNNGNWIPGESYLFIKNFNKEIQGMLNLSDFTRFSMPIVAKSFTHSIVSALEKVGNRDRLQLFEDQAQTESAKRSNFAKHRNTIHPCHSLRIFAVTNMQRAKIDKTIREMIVGHSTGLDKAYYKPQDEEILQEYLKSVDFLTISEENRLKKQLHYYKQKSEGLQEKEQQIKQLDERYEKSIKSLKEEMEQKFQQLLSKIDIQKIA